MVVATALIEPEKQRQGDEVVGRHGNAFQGHGMKVVLLHSFKERGCSSSFSALWRQGLRHSMSRRRPTYATELLRLSQSLLTTDGI